MIAFASTQTAPLVRSMWKTCFGDSEEAMDVFFSQKYKDENTLIYLIEGQPVASLQMLPYNITFYGQLIPFAYLAGLCTLPDYRNRGIMGKLINEAHKVIAERNIPLSILIPAEESLYNYYQKYGYEQTFESDQTAIPLKQLLEQYDDLNEAYRAFNSMYADKDFCVQKSKEDFRAIVDDYRIEYGIKKTNLSGMSRTIDYEYLLQLFAIKNKDKSLSVKLNHTSGDFDMFRIEQGKLEHINKTKDVDIEVNTNMLTRLLFGFRTDELGRQYSKYFEPHHPIINLMLE